MSSRQGVLAGVAAIATASVVSLAVVIALAARPAAEPPVSITSAPGLENTTPPAVASLLPDLVLISHESPSATTEFDVGLLRIRLADKDAILRWVEGAAPTDGGRLPLVDAKWSTLPSNLPVVFSYTPSAGSEDKRVSVFGRLASTPRLDAGGVVYEITLYDAPGKDSTYTVSGSYNIPEVVYASTLTIMGQRIDS